MGWNTWGAYEVEHGITMWPGIGLVDHIKVRKKSGKDGITWNKLQEIKNIVVGEETCVIEVYPRQRDLIDHANCRHLFVVPHGIEVPNLSM